MARHLFTSSGPSYSRLKRYLAVCILVLTSPLVADPQEPSDLMKEVSGSLIALSTPDASASARWYEEKLGFHPVKNGAMGENLRFALLRSGDNIVELIQNPDARPLAEAVPGVKDPFEIHGIFKIGLTVRNLDLVLADLKRRRVKIEFSVTTLNDLGLRSFGIRDMDGNLIQFFGK
jgi:catechol 2,3-dioxygenase-like lactoylglutathione lyase family enzyme